MDRKLGVPPPNLLLLVTGLACPDVVRRLVATVNMALPLVHCNKQKKIFFKFLRDYQEVDQGPSAAISLFCRIQYNSSMCQTLDIMHLICRSNIGAKGQKLLFSVSFP